MAITLRSTKGAALTHVEMDTNLTSYYVSSSLNGSILKLFTHGAGSFSATTHSVDLSSFLDDTDTNTTYSISAETATGGVNIRLTDSGAGTDDVKLASGPNVTITRTDANTITISSQDTIYTHPSITATANTSTATPAHGETFTAIDSVTVNSEGHVTAFNTKTVTLPADNNTTYTPGTGIDIDGSNVISNTAPDQTVVLAGQNITINGTYPNFQLTGSAAVPTDTGSFYVSSSLAASTLTFYQGDGTTEAIDLSSFLDDTNLVTSVNSQTGDITIAEDQTVTLAGQNITINGTYPNFQLTGSAAVATDTGSFYVSSSLVANQLTFYQGDGTTDSVNLSLYLDDTNLAYIIAGVYDTGSQTLIFTRNDSSSFSVDASMFLDDTNLVTSVNSQTGAVTVAEDQTVVLAGQNITVNGTYPNFQLTGSAAYTHPSITATQNTSTASPAHGETFTAVDSVTVNGEGHVTAYNLKTVTLPADNNTTYTAGNGLGLSGTEFSLDTPSTLSVSSTNGVTENSHTHAITTTTNGTASTIVATDASSEITAANFITTSDRRLKSEIEPIKDGLEVIKNIVSYEYSKGGVKEAGFIAQEVQEVLPYAVREGEDGYLKMTDRAILAHLNKAVQQLEERLLAIEEKLG